MIDEDQFATIGMGLFKRRELSRLRPEGFVGCGCGGCREKEEKTGEEMET
jgi:hypothetical protein